MAAEEGKVDPMKQFTIEPLLGSDWQLADGINIAFTNSALWMAITAVLVWVFVAGGMKRALVPGRWQMAVETLTGFIDDLLEANVARPGASMCLIYLRFSCSSCSGTCSASCRSV